LKRVNRGITKLEKNQTHKKVFREKTGPVLKQREGFRKKGAPKAKNQPQGLNKLVSHYCQGGPWKPTRNELGVTGRRQLDRVLRLSEPARRTSREKDTETMWGEEAYLASERI